MITRPAVRTFNDQNGLVMTGLTQNEDQSQIE